MGFKKLKQKLKQKLHPSDPGVNKTRRDLANSQARLKQQPGHEDDNPMGKGINSGSPGGLLSSSTSTSAPIGTPAAPSNVLDGSRRDLQPERTYNDLPIRELWDVAYEDLRESDEDLIRTYEAKLRTNFTAGLSSTVGLTLSSKADRQDQMNTILQRKMDQINRDASKLKLGRSEVQVKDLVQPVLGVIKWANEYITGAVSANPVASVAWAGVSLLLPVSRIASMVNFF